MGIINDQMTRHHKDCDDVFARAEQMAGESDWTGLKREAGRFLSEMERHIAMEEDVLFAAFVDKTGMSGGPVETMCMEHEQMRGMFEQLRAAVEARDAEQYLGVAETLLVLLQQHNMKEENILYPMLDESLGEEARSLLARMEPAAA